MLEFLFDATQEAVRSTLAIIGLFFVIPGLIQCFFGYRVLKLFAAFMGFLVGLAAFTIIGVVTLEALGPGLLMGLAGGLLLALLAFKAYKIAVCLINGVNAFLAAVSFGFYCGLGESLEYLDPDYLTQNLIAGGVLGVLLAVVVMVLTALLFRPLVICSSALEGGLLLGGGLCLMLYIVELVIPLSLLCIVVGAAFQFYSTRQEGQALRQARQQRREARQQAKAQGSVHGWSFSPQSLLPLLWGSAFCALVLLLRLALPQPWSTLLVVLLVALLCVSLSRLRTK